MAVKSRIKVAVVEGDYAELCGLGLPLPLSLQLQCLNLSLSSALWSAKASGSGFSVNLYWPASPSGPTRKTAESAGVKKAKKKRKRGKRRREQAPGSVSNNESTLDTVVVASPTSHFPNKAHSSPEKVLALDSSPPDSPGLVHHPGAAPTIPDDCSIGSLDSPEVDLTECTNIQYAMKDGVHGVSYTGNLEEQGWTPVVGRRRRRSVPDFVKRRFPRDHPIHHRGSDAESESDEEALDNAIPTGGTATVDYMMIDNTPGLMVKTRCTRAWTPIAARTRGRLKKK